MTRNVGDARLILMCGLPGAGKTTEARQLEQRYGAVRLCPDEWLEAIGIPRTDERRRDLVEGLQWDLAQRLVQLGQTVILESGFWGRRDRDIVRDRARELGATVELRFLDVPREELWRRIDRRNSTAQPDNVISREDFETWASSFEAPDASERALFDPPVDGSVDPSPSEVESGYVEKGEVRLHYLTSGTVGPPLLLCPGLSDSADDYRPVLEALAPRRAIAMSFRGQGRSDAPEQGYDLPHFSSDIASVIQGLMLSDVLLFAHSRAVSYAVAAAAEQPDSISTLILGDSAPIHRSYPPEWVENFAASIWRGQRVEERIPRHVLARLQEEATNVDLWDTLARLDVGKVAVIGGAHPPEFVAELEADYTAAGAEVVVFEDAVHDIWEPDFDCFIELLARVADMSRRLGSR